MASGLLFCPKHNRPLHIINSSGAMRCPACQSGPEPALVSSVLREVVERMICHRVASLVLEDESLVFKAVEACRHHAARLQAVDTRPIQELEKQVRVLSDRITFVFDNPGDT